MENLPALQKLHTVAPLADKVLVVDPAEQVEQALAPGTAVYCPSEQSPHDIAERVCELRPGGQAMHWSVEFGEYSPASHAKQLIAPGFSRLLVTEPASQSSHATVDELLYSPLAHGVQLVAPLIISEFVTEPDTHTLHVDVAIVLYWPAEQVMQVVAPTDARVSVTEPGAQVLQLVWLQLL